MGGGVGGGGSGGRSQVWGFSTSSCAVYARQSSRSHIGREHRQHVHPHACPKGAESPQLSVLHATGSAKSLWRISSAITSSKNGELSTNGRSERAASSRVACLVSEALGASTPSTERHGKYSRHTLGAGAAARIPGESPFSKEILVEIGSYYLHST